MAEFGSAKFLSSSRAKWENERILLPGSVTDVRTFWQFNLYLCKFTDLLSFKGTNSESFIWLKKILTSLEDWVNSNRVMILMKNADRLWHLKEVAPDIVIAEAVTDPCAPPPRSRRRRCTLQGTPWGPRHSRPTCRRQRRDSRPTYRRHSRTPSFAPREVACRARRVMRACPPIRVNCGRWGHFEQHLLLSGADPFFGSALSRCSTGEGTYYWEMQMARWLSDIMYEKLIDIFMINTTAEARYKIYVHQGRH